MSQAEPLDAGAFSPWLHQMRHALTTATTSQVPCAGCTACCTSSQFVEIEPGETDALAHIPAALLFPAPRRPDGHLLLGYDDRGHCPMLVENKCSIYEHRPRACRTYDCRVFAASGVALTEPDKAAIAERVRRWRFSYPTDADRRAQDSVERASAYLTEHPQIVVPEGSLGPADQAVASVQIADLFLAGADPPQRQATPDPDAVRVELRRRSRRPAPLPDE